MNDAALRSHLMRLECQLHTTALRRDAAAVTRLLHPNFREFGRSGRSYTRAAMLDLLSGEPDTQAFIVHAQDFDLQVLAPGSALLTYRSGHLWPDGRLTLPAWRSSLWQHEAQGWQMVFHQGTPTADFTPGAD